MTPLRLLIAEDSEEDALLVLHELRRANFSVTFSRVQDEKQMRLELAKERWDVVISDWSMPQFDALRALSVVRQSGLDLPFIIVSGTIGEEAAVAALRGGAHDFILKDKPARLAPAIERELRDARDREARRRAEEVLRKTEEQLRQAQKMEAIGSLAGGVAHDFNNLLSVILTCTDLALEGMPPGDPRRLELEEVLKAGARAADLTRQLLAFSRKQVLQPRVVDLNHIVSGLEKMLRRLLTEEVELVLLTEPSLGTVYADPGQIEQIVINLAVNARDAMPQGGKLTITTRNAEASDLALIDGTAPAPAGYVVLAVADTGGGMDAETRTRIFEPFFTTKEPGKGTGLGLSTVFGIVKQSEGHILVESEPGEGSTFKVVLPRTDKRAVTPSSPPSATKLRGHETILLVEDDDQVRAAMRSVLRRQGYEVLEAQNGGEAFLTCEKHRTKIDLLVTDVVMPRMSGTELAARLAALKPEMKVLFVSGYAESLLAQHGLEERRVAFLQKPTTSDALARKVREVLDAAEE